MPTSSATPAPGVRRTQPFGSQPIGAGAAPPLAAKIEVIERSACDRKPVDLGDAEARQRLRAYVWADQRDRLARLDAAIAVARATGTTVAAADAVDWTRRNVEPRDGAATVLFHSVFWQYMPAESQGRAGRRHRRHRRARHGRRAVRLAAHGAAAVGHGDHGTTSDAMAGRGGAPPGDGSSPRRLGRVGRLGPAPSRRQPQHRHPVRNGAQRSGDAGSKASSVRLESRLRLPPTPARGRTPRVRPPPLRWREA